jgi:hydrogenase maturation protein HypF
MLLEPDNTDSSSYHFEIIKAEDRPWLLPVKPIITGLVSDILGNIPPKIVSRRFHNTLAALFTRACREIRDQKNINSVVLSGGVFQNLNLLRQVKTGLEALSSVVLSGGVFQNLNLLRQVKTGLEALSFNVYAHEQVPTNDGGLSLGQAVAGRAMFEKIKGSRGQGAKDSRGKKYLG